MGTFKKYQGKTDKDSRNTQICVDCKGVFQDKTPRDRCRQCEKKLKESAQPSGGSRGSKGTGID